MLEKISSLSFTRSYRRCTALFIHTDTGEVLYLAVSSYLDDRFGENIVRASRELNELLDQHRSRNSQSGH